MTDMPQHPSSTPSVDSSAGSSQVTARLEPVTENILMPSPWYKRVFNGPIYKTQTVWKLTFLSLLVVGVIVGQSLVQTPTTTTTQAAAGQAKISLFPQNSTMSKEKQIQLWITIDNPMKEATIIVSYDPTVLQLNKDVALVPRVGYSVTVSSKDQSNISGMIEIKYVPQVGVAPVSPGTIQVASIFFSPEKTTTANETIVSIDEKQTQVVSPDSVQFSVSGTNASVKMK